MRVVYAAVLMISLVTCEANFIIDSILEGTEVSIGPYDHSVSVGTLTNKYNKLEPDDEEASQNARQLIELLRRMFRVGIFNLPPLDPFTTKKLKPLEISNTFISGKVHLKSLTVVGAKNFELKLIELRMKSGRVDFVINIPEVNFNVDFETDLFLGVLIPLHFKGQLKGRIIKLELSGALQTEERLHKGSAPNLIYQLSGASVHIQANEIKIELVNGTHIDKDLLKSLFDGEANLSLTQWIKSSKNMINEYALKTFVSLANNVLRGIGVAQVNAYLLPED